MRGKPLFFAVILVSTPAGADPWWTSPPKVDSAETELAAARRGGSLDAYCIVNKGKPAKARYVVRGAYEIAQQRLLSKDPSADLWIDRTLEAFATWKKADANALGSPEADLAAEFAYRKIDARIEKEWSSVSYVGVVPTLVAKVDDDRKLRTQLIGQLDSIETTYGSSRWRAVALARSGAVLDIHRVAIDKAQISGAMPAGTALKIANIVTKAQAILADPASSQEEKLQAQSLLAKAAQIQASASVAWNDLARAERKANDPEMLRRYARGRASGQTLLFGHPAIRLASVRLARFEAELGPIVLRFALSDLQKDSPPFVYQPMMFAQLRPGAFVSAAPQLDTPLAPAPP